MKSYVVESGDTLFGLAQREYGDGSLYPVLALQNHIPDPDVLTVGQQLLVPYVTHRHLFTTADSTAARNKLTEHYYGTQDTNVQLIWEITNGVAQREIQTGAWLHMPDLANVGHHTVVEGETLVGLADRWYGDAHLAVIIELANGLQSGTDPTPGQVLVVPGLNRRRRIAGDTLESLCRDEYGDTDVETRVSVVAAANRISRPDALFSNQVVHFPS